MNDDVFNALAYEPRRALLLEILNEDSADGELESVRGDSASTDADHHVGVVMYHSHLPKLETYGYIEWNRDTHEVSEGPRFDEIRPLLEWLNDRQKGADPTGRPKP